MANENRFRLRMRKEPTHRPAPRITMSASYEKLDALMKDGYSFQVAVRMASEGLPDHLKADFIRNAKEKQLQESEPAE